MIAVAGKNDNLVLALEDDSSVVEFSEGILTINGMRFLDVREGDFNIFSGVENLPDFKPNVAQYDGAWKFDHYRSIAYKKAEEARDSVLFDGSATVEVGGVIYQANPKSIENLNNAITLFSAAGGTPAGYEWRDENNVNHPADLGLLVSIGMAKAIKDNEIWKKSWRQKDALNHATTISEIDAALLA